LREITHKGLARLVGLYGSYPIDSNNLQILEISSIEPDRLNREEIAKGPLKAIKTTVEWLVDHTLKAKELSIQYLNETNKAYKIGDPSWIRWLGWCFHFITDWATPYHSPSSKSNPIIQSTSGRFKTAYENKEGLVAPILDTVSTLIKSKVDHDNFEDICEKRWQQNETLVRKNFVKLKKNRESNLDLKGFSTMMDNLRVNCENLSADWIITSTNQEFAAYMTEIAKVMDFACCIIME
jgi:hypothetical protein